MGWLSGGRRVRMKPERIHKLTSVHRALREDREHFWWAPGDDEDTTPVPKKKRTEAGAPAAVDYTAIMQ
jgi:hypothetical protein